MSLSKNIAITFSAKVIMVGLGLVAGILVARTLGPEGKGIFAFLSALAGIAIQFGNLGLQNANTYFIGKDRTKTFDLLGNSLWVGLILGSIIALGIYAAWAWYPNKIAGSIDGGLIIMTLVSIPFTLLSLFFQNILLGQQAFVLYNIIQILSQVAITVGVIIMMFMGLGIRGLVLLSTAVGIISSITYWVLVGIKSQFSFHFNFPLFKESLRYGIKSYLTTFFAFLILRSDLYLVNLYRGAAETGLYSLAAGFADLFQLLPMSIGMVLFPRLAENQSTSGEVTARVVRITTIIMFFLCLGTGIFAQPIITLLYGEAFRASALPFIILLPGIFFYSIQAVIASNIGAIGLPFYIVYIWLATFLLNFGLNLILVPKYGMLAAASTSLISYIFVYVLMVLAYLKENKLRFKVLIPTWEDVKEAKKHLFALLNRVPL